MGELTRKRLGESRKGGEVSFEFTRVRRREGTEHGESRAVEEKEKK